jgi:hypothetical protein
MLHEPSSRRSSFRGGRQIRLADGQTWILPAPLKASEWKTVPFGSEYMDIIKAMLQAEDSYEQHLAEMAFAIFLLGHNYCLSAGDYEQLLGSTAEFSDSRVWQHELYQLSQEHLRSFLEARDDSLEKRPVVPAPARFARLRTWLRNHSPSRWWSLDSQNL